jgi:predicted N-acyltransferase
MSFEVQLAHSVKEVGQEAWDRLSGGRPFTSYRWYSFGEAVLADNTPVYIILHHQGEPVARATFWLRRQEALPFSSALARRVVAVILRRWPLLLCSSPLADASGLILPDPPLRDEALGTIAQVALDQARQRRVSFLGCIYLEGHEARYPGWPKPFAPVELPDPGTRLPITWPDFDSYLKQLSKKTRRQYRMNCSHAAELGVEISRHSLAQPLDEATLDEAVRLIQSVEQYHGSTSNPWTRGMLKHAGLVGATWLKAEIAGRMVGCCTLLGDGDARVMTLLGRDYDVQYAYFPLIYTAIRCAMEEGARVLWGGTGAYEMKQKLGFQLTSDNYAVFAGRGPLLQRLGRWVASEEESKVTDPYRAGDGDREEERDGDK